MTLTKAQLAELGDDLALLVNELQAGLDGSAEAARPVELDQAAVGRLSRVDGLQQQKMIEAGREALRSRLQLARSALRRFGDGDYGDCLRCGEPVSFARLKARPESFLCIECQAARERE